MKELAQGLLHRHLFKATDVTGCLGSSIPAFCEKAKEILADTGYDTDYTFDSDTPSDTAYKRYEPDAERPATQIYIAESDGQLTELTKCSRRVRELTDKYTLQRYYYPAAVRGRIQTEAESSLIRE